MGYIDVLNTGPVTSVIIVNPSKLNAIDIGMWQQLRDIFGSIDKDPSRKCVVIEGAGETAFSVGADISEFEKVRNTLEQISAFHEHHVWPALAAIAECGVPVVAKIRGVCMGGGLEIALMADLRIAEASARFGIPVARLGFPLAFAETQALFNRVGPAVVAELLIEGCELDAGEALARGLLTRVLPKRTFEVGVSLTIRNICAGGVKASRSHKRQLRRLVRDSSPVTLAERLSVYEDADSDEYREAFRAFIKRKRSYDRSNRNRSRL
jgi:enoyl-CoA hydratase/carnithine racemase